MQLGRIITRMTRPPMGLLNGKRPQKLRNMKKFVYLILLYLSVVANAQTNSADIKHKMSEARQYLNGYLKPLNPAKAFEIFMQCAQAGNPQAMNAVGMQYNQGLGVDTNKTEAFKWFEKAANNGFPKGWYNLGLMYKYANGVEQDFAKAYQCFKKASEMDYPSGWYAEGYMLYKGLGCPQDYPRAFMLFTKGSKTDRPSCMYFLGLSYRNGYGTTTNTDSARYWLRKASEKGYKQAIDELAANDPENIDIEQAASANLKSAKVGTKTPIPLVFKKVKQNAARTDMQGEYSGYVLKYDWSGQYIIKRSKLNVSLNIKDSIVTGQWVEDDTISLTFDAIFSDSALIFSTAQYSRTDHYHPVNPVLWQFKKARLELVKKSDSIYLAGNLQLWSPQTKEPSKPLYLLLERQISREKSDNSQQSSLAGINGPVSDLIAFPNPFNQGLSLSFTLQNPSEVNVTVYGMDGNIVGKSFFIHLPAGKQTLPLTLTVPVGSYLVKVKCGESVVTTIVVKQ